jgi:hypothetical protein
MRGRGRAKLVSDAVARITSAKRVVPGIKWSAGEKGERTSRCSRRKLGKIRAVGPVGAGQDAGNPARVWEAGRKDGDTVTEALHRGARGVRVIGRWDEMEGTNGIDGAVSVRTTRRVRSGWQEVVGPFLPTRCESEALTSRPYGVRQGTGGVTSARRSRAGDSQTWIRGALREVRGRCGRLGRRPGSTGMLDPSDRGLAGMGASQGHAYSQRTSRSACSLAACAEAAEATRAVVEQRPPGRGASVPLGPLRPVTSREERRVGWPSVPVGVVGGGSRGRSRQTCTYGRRFGGETRCKVGWMSTESAGLGRAGAVARGARGITVLRGAYTAADRRRGRKLGTDEGERKEGGGASARAGGRRGRR